MHTSYRIPAIREFRDQQVRFTPRDKRIEQVDRTERLQAEIDTKRTYPFDYLVFRITDFRPDSDPSLKLPGKDVQHDLRLLVEDLSDAADIPVELASERVYTIEDLSKLFKVSTKTISRWRNQGLVSRRFLFDGRKRVGFLKSSVDRFASRNGERIERGAKFSQLDDTERQEIVERARRLAATGGCPAEITKRVASYTGRSVETIRYTLKNFDREHPERAIFPSSTGPLTPDAKNKIYAQFRRGVAVDVLARRYCRNKTSVYRVINEVRAQRILELPLDYIDNPQFRRATAEKQILGDLPPAEQAQRKPRLPSGLPPYLASLYEVPLLTREQEQHLFRKLNYLKFKANRFREQLDPTRAKSTEMDEIERLYEQAVAVKNQIIRANLRLVVSIAKRHVGPADNFFDLVSDGNMSLIRAVEKFDYARGNKFSTYATWAIMKNFARTIPGEHKQRDRFRTSHDEMFSATEDNRTNHFEQESAQHRRESDVSRILDRLDEREQRIIISRFGLDYRQEPQTLKEVGAELGVTKERIRQIEARALTKLRQAAQEEKIELSF